MNAVKLLAAVPKTGIADPNVNGDTLYLNDYFSAAVLGDVVIVTPGNYEKIFGKTKSASSTEKKLLSVVKIEYVDATNRKMVIHRRCYCLAAAGFSQDMAALTHPSINILAGGQGVSSIQGKEVKLSKGCWLPYYWYHPFHATRITMRLGLPSLILAIVSFIISLLSGCC